MSDQGGGFGRWRGRQQGWDPMGELQSLRSELRRLVGGRSGPPEVELTEVPDGWEVIVRLPGVVPEEVAVELDDRELCVRARSEAEVNADQGIPGGFETRGFEYRVELPIRVDPDAIDAVMDHGLLRVHLPRAARPAPRTITVGRAGPRTGSLGGRTPAPGDPAADRELHRPDTAVGEIDRP
ncbi:Hsp20/alpha crystallin family protein [Micromonospora sp. NPDC023737]|uniref:Hsp20/alpha crystallin family protein n=1 Tax=unclassified Micromonospora TaxID=2617518 RepID=UPI0033C6AB7D